MIVKRNRHNNNFQIAYFIAGSCFTPDAAYFALLNQRDERQRALDAEQVAQLRRKARQLQIDSLKLSSNPVDQLTAQADQLELDNEIATADQLIQACREELSFTDLCIERIQPLRKYSHLPDAEAAEVCQREEIGMEFQFRIENYLMSSGAIPHNELATMRQHPDFEQILMPHIQRVQTALTFQDGSINLLPQLIQPFDLPALLGYDKNAT